MPVYEFYCGDCHTIFNFISSRVNTEKRPACPKCGLPELERQVSLFAIFKGRSEEPVEGMPDLDEAQMERAMMALAGEMGSLDEEDPRQMARFMRRFSEVTGMNLGEGMEEAMRRLEAGEDPEAIEEQLGDVFDAENPFGKEGIKGLRRKYAPPAHDDTLYRLEG
ncbi:cytochrome c [Desulfuromonas versatilis]|uniref:Cytochrome c n=1 Tax=Desulfuromonas versatilis TaxID=2802975 RepID=A0ABM8HP91_9BACT|nr:zinc ribbon domain-containing protein [Desulfuromonas versatilis]BCR03434.1 cytochrome c [Desulfuromonas versatilis]